MSHFLFFECEKTFVILFFLVADPVVKYLKVIGQVEKGMSLTKKRKKSMESETSIDNDNDNYSKSKKFYQIYKTAGGIHWNHNTADCGRFK